MGSAFWRESSYLCARNGKRSSSCAYWGAQEIHEQRLDAVYDPAESALDRLNAIVSAP